MTDNNTKLTKGVNWDLLTRELKKFNISLNAQQKKNIVEDTDNEELSRILTELMNFDNSTLAMAADRPGQADNGFKQHQLPDGRVEISQESDGFEDNIDFDKNGNVQIQKNRYGIEKQNTNNQKQKNAELKNSSSLKRNDSKVTGAQNQNIPYQNQPTNQRGGKLNTSNPNDLNYLNDSLNVRDDDYYGDGNANGSRNNLQNSKGKNQNNLNYSGQQPVNTSSESDDLNYNGQVNLKQYDGFQNSLLPQQNNNNLDASLNQQLAFNSNARDNQNGLGKSNKSPTLGGRGNNDSLHDFQQVENEVNGKYQNQNGYQNDQRQGQNHDQDDALYGKYDPNDFDSQRGLANNTQSYNNSGKAPIANPVVSQSTAIQAARAARQERIDRENKSRPTVQGDSINYGNKNYNQGQTDQYEADIFQHQQAKASDYKKLNNGYNDTLKKQQDGLKSQKADMTQKALVGRVANSNDPQFAVGSVKYDNDYGGLDKAAVGYAGNQRSQLDNLTGYQGSQLNKSKIGNQRQQLDQGYENNGYGIQDIGKGYSPEIQIDRASSRFIEDQKLTSDPFITSIDDQQNIAARGRAGTKLGDSLKKNYGQQQTVDDQYNQYVNAKKDNRPISKRGRASQENTIKKQSNKGNSKSNTLDQSRKSSYETVDRRKLGGKQESQLINLERYQSEANFSTNLSNDDGYNPVNYTNNGQPQRDLESFNYTSEMIFLTMQDILQVPLSTVQGLLKDNHKLFQIACKNGLKGGDYSKLLRWYQLLSTNPYVDKLAQLLYKENEVCNTYDVLKQGLYSKNTLLLNQTIKLFIALSQKINVSNLESLHGLTYQWLTQDRVAELDEVAPSGKAIKSKSPARPGIKSKPPRSPEKIYSNVSHLSNPLYKPPRQINIDRGLKSFIYGFDKENKKYDQNFSYFLEVVGYRDYGNLLITHLMSLCVNNLQYYEWRNIIFNIQIKINPQILIDSGLMKLWIEDSIKKTEEVDLEIKLQSMTFLIDLWTSYPLYIQGKTNEGVYAEIIVSILKKQCRHPSLMVSIFSINAQFILFEEFTRTQNVFAPKIYKALTFLLIDSYYNLDLRNEILNNFIKIFRTMPQIPIKILCEPYFKTLFINQEKQAMQTAKNNTNFMLPTSEYFALNTTDFNFFIRVALHPKLTLDVALQLMEIVTEITLTNLTYVRISLNILMTIITRFNTDATVIAKIQETINDFLQKIYRQDERKVNIFLKCNRDRLRNKYIKNKKNMKQPGKVVTLGRINAPASPTKAQLEKFNFSLKPYQKKVFDQPEIESKIAPGDSLFGGEKDEFLTDREIGMAISNKEFPQEIARLNNLCMNEKMMINLIQALLNTNIPSVLETSKVLIRDTYIKTEREQVFKNNGLLYLLKHWAKQVEQVFQEFNDLKVDKKKERERKRKEAAALVHAKQQEKKLATLAAHAAEQEFVNYTNNMKAHNRGVRFEDSVSDNNGRRYKNSNRETSLVLPTTGGGKQLHLSTINENIISLTNSVQGLPRVINYGMASNNIDNQYLYGEVAIGTNAPNSTNRKSIGLNRKSLDSIKLKSLDNRGNNQISDYPYQYNTQKKSAGGHRKIMVSNDKNIDYFQTHHGLKPLINIEELPESEHEFYINWSKYYSRLYKTLFKKYARITNKKANSKPGQFDGLQQAQTAMDISEVYSFLNDYKIELYSRNPDGSKKKFNHHDIGKLIKAINVKEKFNPTSFRSHGELDIQGFYELVLQAGHFSYDESDMPSWFLPKLFDRMKSVAQKSDRPLFKGLLDNPNLTTAGDKELIAELNKKANEDPYGFQVPDGYVMNLQMIRKQNSEAENAAKSILNDIMVDTFGIQQFDVFTERYVVKKDEKDLEKLRNVKPQYFDLYLKQNQTSGTDDQTTDTSQRQPSRTTANSNSKFENFKKQNQRKIKERNDKTISRSRSPNRRKPVQNMVSTIPPKLDVTIKLQMALNKDIDKDVAYLMDDMLRALEQGKRKLTPRAQKRNNDAIVEGEQWKARGQKKRQQLKQDQDKQWKEDQKLKDKKRKERQDIQKVQIAQAYKDEQKRMKILKEQQQQDEVNQQLKKAKDERLKAQFYDKITEKYNQKREILTEQQEEQQEKDEIQKEKEKEERKQKQIQLDRKNKQNIQDLFNKKLQQRIEEQEKIDNAKLQAKHAVGKTNDKLLQNRDQKQIKEAFEFDSSDSGRNGHDGFRSNAGGRRQGTDESNVNLGTRGNTGGGKSINGGRSNVNDTRSNAGSRLKDNDNISQNRRVNANASQNSRAVKGGLKQSKSVVGLKDDGRIPPINNRNNNDQGHTKNNLTALQSSQSYVQNNRNNDDINNSNFQINLQGVGKYGPNEIPTSLSGHPSEVFPDINRQNKNQQNFAKRNNSRK